MLNEFSDIRSPFAALRRQLGDTKPGGDPIDMTVGSPRHQPPDFIADALSANIDTVGSYPSITGSQSLREAISNWTNNRFDKLSKEVTPDNCLPLNGSREGLFYAIFVAKARRPEISKPIVLMPNPFYQVYGAAAIAAGAIPHLLNTAQANGFLPDLSSIDPQIRENTIALYLCNPSNPEGATADLPYLKDTVQFARNHNLMLFSDECYSEIYRDKKPPSALEAAINLSNGFENILAFNSLSKRSNVPGLRSGFVAGDQSFIAAFTQFRNVAGPQMPGPIQHASSLLWREESHVENNRDLYNKKFDLADLILKGRYSYKKPSGGFFLWLNLSEFGGGIAATTTLWKECGVKVLPGAYLAQSDDNGKNPGEDYARAALVGSIDETKKALEKIVRVF